MQAKQPNKDGFDQQFEDYAWSQMSTLLDQELPVQEEKKRRWLFWLFLFFGLSVSGAIVYQVFQGDEQVKVEVERPIAEKDNLKKGDSEIVKDQKPEVGSRESEIRNQKSEIGNQISEVRNQKLEIGNRKSEINGKLPSSTKETKSNNFKSAQISSNQLEQHQTSSNNIKPAQTISKSEALEPSQAIKQSNNQTIEQLLPVLPMNISPIEPITSATRSITAEPIVRKISKWELATRLGGIATLEGEMHFTLGTDLQYHFKPKWSVHSGASWIVRQGSSLFALTEADEANVDLEMIDTMGNNIRTTGMGNNNTETYSSAFQDSIIRTDSPKYNFLRIPLSLEYRLSNRLAVFGGMEVLMPLNRKSSSDDLASNAGVFFTASDPNMDNTNSNSNNIFISPSWQWHTGIHFRATKRFSVDFSYHHILPKQSDKNHLEQYLELGLRYNIFSP